MPKIEDILSQRSDLSTFLVHLTKDSATKDGMAMPAVEALKRILQSGEVQARNSFGHAVSKLRAAKMSLISQRCVCLTETPLVHLRLLLGEIEGRKVPLKPYGIALPKKIGRLSGINPVWYLNMTPGAKGGWLSEPWNKLIDEAIANHTTVPFDQSSIAKLTPFIEQMGTWSATSRKEFWWEREWRKLGKLELPQRFIVIAPEKVHGSLRTYIDGQGKYSPNMPLIDANWSLEQIIGGLAGFAPPDLGL